jgi:hypothetical protein
MQVLQQTVTEMYPGCFLEDSDTLPGGTEFRQYR